MSIAEVPQSADALRLVAVPVLAWAAYRDVKVRRVPTRTWYPLVALGVALLAWDAWRLYHGDAQGHTFERQVFPIRVAVSLGIVVPFSYLVWRLGGFGGADAKAIIALAVLFPTYPSYVIAGGGGSAAVVLPLSAGRTAIGVFSLTILTNTVLLGATYPVVLAGRNLLAGDVSRLLAVGRPVAAESVVRRHGSLLETPAGYTRSGLDVDALRMYLRWRGATLADLRADPDHHRNPASLPAERNDPGDGAITSDDWPPSGPDPVGTDPSADGGEQVGGEEQADVEEQVGGEEQADVEEQATVRSGGPDADETAPQGGDPDGTAPPPGGDPDDEWGAAAFLDDVGWGAYGTSPEDLRGGLEVLAAEDEVWYSPGIPFIVPMFAGLLAALTVGDLLWYVLRWLALV